MRRCARLWVSIHSSFFFPKNLFYKTVEAEISQSFKNIPRLRVSENGFILLIRFSFFAIFQCFLESKIYQDLVGGTSCSRHPRSKPQKHVTSNSTWGFLVKSALIYRNTIPCNLRTSKKRFQAQIAKKVRTFSLNWTVERPTVDFGRR